MRMRHILINEAAGRFEKLTDEIDPTTVRVDKIDDLLEVAAASEIVRTNEVRLREAVRGCLKTWQVVEPQCSGSRSIPASSPSAVFKL